MIIDHTATKGRTLIFSCKPYKRNTNHAWRVLDSEIFKACYTLHQSRGMSIDAVRPEISLRETFFKHDKTLFAVLDTSENIPESDIVKAILKNLPNRKMKFERVASPCFHFFY